MTAIAAEERLDTERKLIRERIVTLLQRTDFIWLGEALRLNHDVAYRTTPAASFTAWGSSGGAEPMTEPSSSVVSLRAFPVLISKTKRSVSFP